MDGGVSTLVEVCLCGWRRVIVGEGVSLWVEACHCGRGILLSAGHIVVSGSVSLWVGHVIVSGGVSLLVEVCCCGWRRRVVLVGGLSLLL